MSQLILNRLDLIENRLAAIEKLLGVDECKQMVVAGEAPKFNGGAIMELVRNENREQALIMHKKIINEINTTIVPELKNGVNWLNYKSEGEESIRDYMQYNVNNYLATNPKMLTR